MSVIRQDSHGLFVIAGGYCARPGAVGGYSHAYNMTDGGLKAGDMVRARHIAGTPLIKLKLSPDVQLAWHIDSKHDTYSNSYHSSKLVNGFVPYYWRNPDSKDHA